MDDASPCTVDGKSDVAIEFAGSVSSTTRLLRRVFLARFLNRNENETSQQVLAFREETPLAGSELLQARSLAVFAVYLLIDST